MFHRHSLFALTLVSCTAFAQTQEPSHEAAIQARTQLVVVDVVVQDKAGRPIHGLKAQNFVVSENKASQLIRNFEEHTAPAVPPHPPEFPKLPPGVFTDYTPVAPDSTLNILLLDTLNTPTKDQNYVRNQLQQYVKHADPAKRIAIFGLTSHLILLQGFSSNPEILKDAVEHKLIPRGSVLLDDPAGTNADNLTGASAATEAAQDDPSVGALAQVAANLTQFEAEQQAFQTQLRLQYTLDAFNDLAHYLSNFPGRKNLLWFSGAFPINIMPDTTLQNPFAVVSINEDEFRETTSLLSRSQVAVYPIDARGLMVLPNFDAANSGRQYVRNQNAFSNDLIKFEQSQADEHSTMSRLAEETGGAANYNTNDLASAVNNALSAGSNYYTLSYTPTDRRQDGSYREIRVAINGVDPNSVQLAYRHGYYTVDEARAHKRENAAATPASSATAPPAPATPGASPSTPPAAPDPAVATAAAYARAAMARGAPTPTDILFKVRVLPASKSTEPNPAPGNTPNPAQRLPGAWQRYDLDYVALPNEFTLRVQPDGKHRGRIEFIAFAYDADGRLLNTASSTIALNLPPDAYKRYQQGAINFHLEISAPAKQDTYLRIGLRDLTSNRFGAVEIPTASVIGLAPPVYPAAPAQPKPASPPATPALSPTAPSNPPAPSTAPPS